MLVAVEAGALSVAVIAGEAELASEMPAAADAPAGTFSLGPGQAVFFSGGMAETPPLGGAGSITLLRLGIASLAADDGSPNQAVAARAVNEAVVGVGVGDRVLVVVPEARLRETPSLDGALIVGLPQGSLLVVTGPVVEGSSLLWYPVQSAVDPALTGFIAADLVGTEP